MNKEELKALCAFPKTRTVKFFTILFLALVILIMSCLPLKLFVTGSPRCADIAVSEVYASESEIRISGQSKNTAESFRSYSLSFKEGSAFFTLNYVISTADSDGGCFDITKEGDFSKIDKIYIKGEKENSLVWEKET